MSESPGLAEQALNKAAEIGLSSQLDEVENLDVNIKTDPLKMVQGQVDGVDIIGQGLVMQKDLRMEGLEMQMDNLTINPLSVAFGKIELTKPTEASARVVLTENDINRAFNSKYVCSQLQNKKIHVNGQSMSIEPKHVNFRLLDNQKIGLNATIQLKETSETQQIAFSAVPKVSANGQTISLENVEYGEGEEISAELTKTLIDQTGEILNLSNFDIECMSLQVKQLQVETGKLTLQAEAYVAQIPSA